MNNGTTDKSLMKKGMEKQYYELRYIDEEDNYRPLADFQALDKKRKLSAFNIDKVAFCEIKLSNLNPNLQPELLLEKISKLKKPEDVVLKVIFQGYDFQTNLRLNSDQIIKDIFPLVKNRIQINP